jgi:hypothetical protein
MIIPGSAPTMLGDLGMIIRVSSPHRLWFQEHFLVDYDRKLLHEKLCSSTLPQTFDWTVAAPDKAPERNGDFGSYREGRHW